MKESIQYFKKCENIIFPSHQRCCILACSFSGGDSESTLFIDIASPIDSYATRKRNANLENVSLEVDLMSPDLDVLDSYKKISQEK